jgi:hypothetical protein
MMPVHATFRLVHNVNSGHVNRFLPLPHCTLLHVAICTVTLCHPGVVWLQVEIISNLPEDATISLYRCGPMVDLCRGPHLPNTSLLKATAVQAFSRSFWRGDVKKEGLQVPTT